MAYVKAEDGSEFGGVSGFALGLGSDGLGDVSALRPPTGVLSEDALKALALANPEKYKAYLKKLDAAKIAKNLADAAIEKMKADPKYGPVFAAAVKGAENPKAVADKAKAWAAKMTGGVKNLDEAALRMFYSQAYAGMDLLDSYVTINPVARSVMQDIDNGIGLFGETSRQIKKFHAEGIDAGGITDAAMLVSKTAGFVNSIVQRSKLSARGKRIFGEITDWAGIATGCAAGVVVSGSVGAMGCAAAGMVKLFGMMAEAFSGPVLEITDPVNIPMGYFQPSSTQMPQVVADAIRLASVLKYRYGIKSWESIIPKKRPLDAYEQKHNHQFRGMGAFWQGYPEFNPYSDSVPIPFACTPGEARTIVDNMVAVMNDLAPNHPPPPGKIYKIKESSIGHDYRRQLTGISPHGDRINYTTFGDFDIDAVYWGARYCREAGWRSDWKAPVTLESPQLLKYTFDGYRCCQKLKHGINLQTDLIYSELVNYFAAVTVHQINNERKAINPLLFGPLPVRYWYCGKNEDNEDPRQAQPRYSKWIFTMVRGPGNCKGFYDPKSRGNVAISPGNRGNHCAIRELGHIRLMAALSYIQMIYKWGRDPKKIGSKGEDMIADLDTMTSNVPGHMLRLPVNPRTKYDYPTKKWGPTPSIGVLKTQLLALAKKMTSLQNTAKAQAERDHMFKMASLAGQAKLQMLMQEYGAPAAAAGSTMTSAAMKAMVQARGAQLISDERKKCLAAGGEWFEGGAQCDVNLATKQLENCRKPPAAYTGKRYNCVPAGTPGAQKIPPSGILPTDRTGPGAPAGAGTIFAVAGAGLLLMQLLKS